MQGKELATQVSTLRKAAEVTAAELELLQKQQDDDKASAADLAEQLADAEEEIAVLRLQAERAAILEVQSEISSRLVEDLQVRISAHFPQATAQHPACCPLVVCVARRTLYPRGRAS